MAMKTPEEVKVKIPLEDVLNRRYLHMHHYEEDFISQVHQSSATSHEYDVVISLQKRPAAAPAP